MKLLRHGPAGAEKPGALDATGQARDLSLLVPDFTPGWLSPAKLQALAAIDLARMPLVPAGTRIGAPVTGTRQFVAIGLNYRKHAEESGLEIPKEPLVFNKAVTSIAGPNDDVPMPEGSVTCDWEIELGFVIGTLARKVLSRFMTLLPGDLVITGTPEGVGLGVKPTPVFLKRGDVMTLNAGRLGTQCQQVT